jgi:hypothetical protein
MAKLGNFPKMAGDKKRLPEHVATQLANPVPIPPGERRTAALPHAPVPTAGPNQRTMTFDPFGPAGGVQPHRRAPMQTVMTTPATPRRKPSTAGRWVGGPILSILIGALTVWIAGMVNAAGVAPQKPHGRLRLSSDPEGATVMVDGKLQTTPTPTVIEGDVGATLRVGFRLDGYLDKEADVFVGEGEHPFRAKLDKREVAPPPPEPVVETPPSLQPPVAPPIVQKKKKVEHVQAQTGSQDLPPIPVASGTGTLSVHVRPWAIIYIDGAKIRQTPLDGHSIAAGLHVVELVNEGIHKKEKVTLEVRSNGHEEIRRDWEK